MRLSELSALIPDSRIVGPDVEIEDITLDSKSVEEGFLFCATRGARFDGNSFIEEAISRGARAVMVSDEAVGSYPQLIVPSVRHGVGRLANALCGSPSKKLNLVGITGTNGKTTTSYLLDGALRSAGHQTGLIGTIEARVGEAHRPSIYTTPEAPELHRFLAEMVKLGVDSAVMEVSSHGIEQHRIDGADFKIAIFTNLATEHLDYHGTIEQYYYAKSLLFDPKRCELALICIDDEWGMRLAHYSTVPTLTYGFSPSADLVISSCSSSVEGTKLSVKGLGLDREIFVRVVGSCNAQNAAGAYLAATRLGVDPEVAARGIAATPGVEGRFQQVHADQDFLVVVDYAHTPDSIRGLITTARDLIAPDSKVILVAGARGRRDRLKRPELGRAAATADLVFLTTDNPGDENPEDIITQLLAGTVDIASRNIEVELDRRLAIEKAVRAARPGDAVLIVGRGHETSFRVGDHRLELDDREAATDALEKVLASNSRLKS